MTDDLRDRFFDDRVELALLEVRHGTIARCSAAARALLGGQVGEAAFSLFDAGSRDKLAQAMATAPTSCEVQARPGGGELIAVRLAVVPLEPDAHLLLVSRLGAEYSERLAQTLLAANDQLANLTRELSRRSAELEAARTRFEALADSREHFVSMLAHDVRGALQGISLSADVIEQAHAQGAREREQAAIARVRKNAARIDALANKVLEAARTETGRVVLDAQPTSVRSVVRDAIEAYAPLADRAGVHVELVGHLEDETVSGDPVRLGQAIGNLIENAIRHSPRGGTVRLELSDSPGEVRLVIRDEGPGIPSELREHVFDRFVRGPGASGSLGLGLYVARQLVELHGGRLQLDDSALPGAAFVITLPRTR